MAVGTENANNEVIVQSCGHGDKTDERRSRSAQRGKREAGRRMSREHSNTASEQSQHDKSADIPDTHTHVESRTGIQIAARAGKDKGDVGAAQPCNKQAHAQETHREDASRRGLLLEVVGDLLGAHRRPLLRPTHEAPFLSPSYRAVYQPPTAIAIAPFRKWSGNASWGRFGAAGTEKRLQKG